MKNGLLLLIPRWHFQQMDNFFLYVPQYFVKDNPTNIITSLWVETNLSYQSFSYLIQQL